MIKSNYSQVKFVLWLILFANFAVALAKIVVGLMIKSASVMADGFHSLTDGSSNIIGLIGIGLASKPVDEDHPYGHQKYETLTSLFIVGMLLFLGIQIVSNAIQKFANPTPIQLEPISFIVMIITLLINLFVAGYEKKRGVALNSTILVSDSMHTRSDIFVTIGVISALVGMKLGLTLWIDPITSLVVAGFIFKAGYEIFRMTSTILLDSAVVTEEEVRKVIKMNPLVKGVHHVRSRGTMESMFIDMHVLADPSMTLLEVHQLTHDLEQQLREHFHNNVQVITHMEPFNSEYKKTP